jgi:hypothetical protein
MTSRAVEFMCYFAEMTRAETQDLRAASILAQLKLKKGSRIDVWADGQFWAARITEVSEQGFTFRYCCKYGNDGGFVERGDFQTTWRFPVENMHQVVLAEALQKVMDPVVV